MILYAEWASHHGVCNIIFNWEKYLSFNVFCKLIYQELFTSESDSNKNGYLYFLVINLIIVSMSQIFFIFIILLSKFRLLYLFSCHFQEIKNLTYSTLIFSTKNCASSFSGISADSRSRYSESQQKNDQSALSQSGLQDGFKTSSSHVCLCKAFAQTNCQIPLSRLTILLMCFPSGFMYHSELYTKILDTLIIIFLDFSPQGFHPLCIRELRSFSSSFIL